MLKIILPIYKENFNLQKFQKTLQVFLQIMNIKNFYGYPNVDKKIILKQFYRGYRKTGFKSGSLFWIFKLPQSQDMVEEKKLAMPF